MFHFHFLIAIGRQSPAWQCIQVKRCVCCSYSGHPVNLQFRSKYPNMIQEWRGKVAMSCLYLTCFLIVTGCERSSDCCFQFAQRWENRQRKRNINGYAQKRSRSKVMFPFLPPCFHLQTHYSLLSLFCFSRFEHILKPIAEIIISKEQRGLVDFDSFFTHTICHECCHGIGPHSITLPDGRTSSVRKVLLLFLKNLMY